jgi:hypothetical protein
MIIKKLGENPLLCAQLDKTEKNPFRKHGHKHSFTYSYPNNDLYVIDEALNLKKKIEYDFGKYTFTANVLPNDIEQVRNFFMEKNERYIFVSNKYENINYYFAFLWFKNEMYISRFNKETQTQDIISWKFKLGGMLLPPILIDNNSFSIITDNQYLNNIIYPPLLDKQSKIITTNINEDDNLVIIKYYLNE